MRQLRKRLQARALKASRSFMVKPHNLQSPEGAELRCMLLWLSGYGAARRDQKRALLVGSHGVKGPTGRRGVKWQSAVQEHRAANPGLYDPPGFERAGVLTIPALNSSEPRPRPKVGQDVRLLVVRDCFQVKLKVGDVGEVIKDDGGLLTVQWRMGHHMWIDADDVAVVGDGIWA